MILTNKGLKLEIYGESHGESIGMVLSGIRSGEYIDTALLQSFVDRRRSSKNVFSTTRLEPDKIIIKSGIVDGYTNGQDISIEIKNLHQISKDYDELRFIPRPSHADYPVYIKHNGTMNMAGGGKFSGRLTAPICIAGGIAVQCLQKHGVSVGAFISQIGKIKSDSYKTRDISLDEINATKLLPFPVLNPIHGQDMLDAISQAKSQLDSLGGVIEAMAFNVPAGWGDAMFDSLESTLSALLFGIPAVKAVEFGHGFDITEMTGSKANDEYYYKDSKVATYTNHNGGILGGLSNGMPIAFRVAIKPVPSIAKEQQSVNLKTKENVKLQIKGRHDACIVPRAVVVVESALALALLDCLYR